jgi:hypothetical protein
MRPKIKDQVAWQQAELLKQPALIRLLRHIEEKLGKPGWEEADPNTEMPYPGYRLGVEYNNQKLSLDTWELCYQVCFKNYQLTHAPQESQEVEIDTNLIDHTGDVDWTRIDEKARMIIDQFFDNLSKEVGQS